MELTWHGIGLIVTWIILILGGGVTWGKMQQRLKDNDEQTKENRMEIDCLKKKVADSVKFEQLETMMNSLSDSIVEKLKSMFTEFELKLIKEDRLKKNSDD